MVYNMKIISAGEFKNTCLKLMDNVAQTHEELIITKKGKPIAKLVPFESNNDPFGFMKGSVVIKGDIVNFNLDQKWEAE